MIYKCIGYQLHLNFDKENANIFLTYFILIKTLEKVYCRLCRAVVMIKFSTLDILNTKSNMNTIVFDLAIDFQSLAGADD